MAGLCALALLVVGLLPTASAAGQNGEKSAGGQSADKSLQPTIDATQASRATREEAIVITVGNPNEECFGMWLEALARTRGPQRDVIVLYGELPTDPLLDVHYVKQIPCPDKLSWQTWGSVWGTSKGVKAAGNVPRVRVNRASRLEFGAVSNAVECRQHPVLIE